MNLFQILVEEENLNMIFKKLIHHTHEAERSVIQKWADGFIDRDNKFVKEFQTTFESSFWELYLFAMLKELNVNIDFTKSTPDFVCEKRGVKFCLEATIANPEVGGIHAYGFDEVHLNFDIDFQEFNRKSIIRICNSIISKARKYQNSYKNLEHVIGKSLILGLNSFDRPHSHLIGNKGVIAVLYGIYLNEEKCIAEKLDFIPHEKLDFITKDNGAEISLGFFTTPEYEDISAIVYNPLATWGKLRALGELNEYNKMCIFNAFYSTEDSKNLKPEINNAIPKENYKENLLDGLYIFHNPYAKYPLHQSIFESANVAHISIDENGNLIEMIKERFLLSRSVIGIDVETSDQKQIIENLK